MSQLGGMCIVKRTHKNKSNEIINRIAVGNLMFGSNYIQIDKSCTNLIKFLDLAEYDKKGKLLDDTKTHYNDAGDAWFYTWIDLINEIRKIILSGSQYQE